MWMEGHILEFGTWFFKWPLEVEGHKPEVCVKRVVSSLHANLDQRKTGDRSPPCLLPSKECSKMRFLYIFSWEVLCAGQTWLLPGQRATSNPLIFTVVIFHFPMKGSDFQLFFQALLSKGLGLRYWLLLSLLLQSSLPELFPCYILWLWSSDIKRGVLP